MNHDNLENRREMNKRFMLVRAAYGVSGRKLTQLMGYRASSLISNIESGQGMPTNRMMRLYQKFFGVSADWLLDCNVPCYQEGVVFTSEKILFEEYETEPVGQKFLQALPSNYLCYSKRRELYPLEFRANLIFLLYVLKDSLFGIIDGALAECNDSVTLYDVLSNIRLLNKICKERKTSLGKQDRQILANFVLLMARKVKEPIYKL